MENNEFYRKMLDNIYEGVYFVDENRKITFWNKGAERITGFSAKEVLGKYCLSNILNHVDENGKKLCLDGCPLHKTIKDGVTREADVFLHHKNGHRVPVSIKAISIMENNEIVGAAELFVDESEKHEILKATEEYKVLAMTDQLTGLPNRRYIDTFLSSKYSEFKELGIPMGILFIDIDHFKNFNDTYGHDVGDDVLRMISQTCLVSTRATDLIGRFGGEEFIAVFAGINKETIIHKAEQLRMLVENSSLRTQSEELMVTVSIGATMINEDDSISTLLARADSLLYQSKDAGRNKVTYG
ncbi:MAG: sensor domain-containing diguanylate cyclase [Proteocatella sp.]